CSTSTSSTGAVGSAVTGTGAPPGAAARSTSSATTRPSGPVPATALSSMPRSRAIRRASGEALIRPPLSADGCLTSATGSPMPAAARRPRSRSSSRARPGDPSARASSSTCSAPAPLPEACSGSTSLGISSPCSPITAIVLPTGTSPSATAIFNRTPEASASTSCVTLSVSSSYSGSPFCTSSPSDFSHLTIVPDSIPCPSRGSLISVAIPSYGAANRRQHVARVRHDPLLHHRRERKRRELRPDALDRRVQPVEGLVLEHGGDLGAEAHPCHGLVRVDAAVRLLLGRDERLLVERLQRARVADLDGDALALGLLGGAQR